MIEPLPAFYEFGPFAVDVGRRLLLRSGEPVQLSPKVLETLLALIEHRERVLSKDELLRLVWGDTIVEEGGLARNISLLRKVLGEKPEDHHYIVTVPARGYRFVAEVRTLPPAGASSNTPSSPGQERPRWTLSARHRLAVGAGGAVALGLIALIFALRPAPTTDPGGRSTSVNPAAHDLVLRARYLSVRTTDADTEAAIGLLEQAVALDPTFAAAYGDLAAAYVTRLTFVTPEHTSDLEQKAFAAAEKALLLDPNVAEAYLARGDLLWTHAHHFAHERAAREFRRAVDLKPDSDQGHRRLARLYVHVGFFEDALRHAARALTINPSNAQALNSRAQALLWMGKDEEALDALLSIPGPVLPELVEANTAFALMRLGRRDEAWHHLRRAQQKYPDDPSGTLSGIEAMLLADSEPLQAQALIARVVKRKAVNPSHHAAYFAGSAWARMGRVEEAVGWLREAAGTGFPCYPLFAQDPNLDRIRQDPHFQAFLAEMQKRFEALRVAVFSGQ
jgi:DNA-binding winged helix-turn-helix (wHTH) protein/Tfp pilus assembly protein PilF